MTTGGVNSETFQRTMDAGAISWGCWSIKDRRELGGFPVGCYSVEHYVEHYAGDDDDPVYDPVPLHFRDWKYFAMCNHGSMSKIGADTRQDAIYLAKQSPAYCHACEELRAFWWKVNFHHKTGTNLT